MADVFDEVEKELRRERYSRLLGYYGPWAAAVAVVVLLGVFGYQGLTHWRSMAAENAAQRYDTALAALGGGDRQIIGTQLRELIADGPSGYATLALMQEAAIAVEDGENEQAARLFEQAAERVSEPLIRDLARYKAVLADFDGFSYDDVVLRLEKISDENATLVLLARELMAAAAMREQRWRAARERYQELALALDVPSGLRLRIDEALSYINQNAPPAVAADIATGSAQTATTVEREAHETDAEAR